MGAGDWPGPKGYVWSSGKVWANRQASWGSWVPIPGCLRQRGSNTTTRAGVLQEWQAPGYLGPRPWLFGAARSQGRAHVDNLTGSWVPSLAVSKSSSGKQGHRPARPAPARRGVNGTPRGPLTGQGKCAAPHSGRVSVANGQPAPRRRYAPRIDTQGHWSGHWSRRGSATNGQPYPCRQCMHSARGSRAIVRRSGSGAEQKVRRLG